MNVFKYFLIAACLISSPSFAQSIPASDAKDYAIKAGNKIIEVVESKVSDEQKQATLISLLKDNSDTDYMAKFVMGKFFRQASKDQQKKYLQLYQDYVIYSYIPRFREYEGEKQQVFQALEKGNNEYIVKTTITSLKAKNGKVNVDYRLLRSGNSFRIIDVIAEGVSLLTTQRSDFAAPLSQRGVEFFLGKLEDKVKRLKAEKWSERKNKSKSN